MKAYLLCSTSSSKFSLKLIFISIVSLFICSNVAIAGKDPFASNNTVYPTADEWDGNYRTSNYDYPLTTKKKERFDPYGKHGLPKKALTTSTVEAYVNALKDFISSDMQGALNSPLTWSPKQVGWYDMPWMAQGSRLANGSIDAESGRDAILGSYTGQILPPNVYKKFGPDRYFQNHGIVYYNDVAATLLAKVWNNPFKPNLKNTQFPDMSIAMKVESVALSPAEWAPIQGSSVSYIYRPTVKSLMDENQKIKKPVVTPIYFTQIALKIKDKIASPDTGWIFIGFAYDKDAAGATVWDKAVPVGAMWGNDPAYANTPSGQPPNGKKLEQTWINPNAPAYATQTVGWGGRLAAPMDVAVRHNVVTVSGTRYPKNKTGLAASSCMSCHSSAQVPFIANLYPSPNSVFPQDNVGEFLLYDPGSSDWSKWFENRPGTQAMSGNNRSGITAMDYDLLLSFAIGTADAAGASNTFVPTRKHGH